MRPVTQPSYMEELREKYCRFTVMRTMLLGAGYALVLLLIAMLATVFPFNGAIAQAQSMTQKTTAVRTDQGTTYVDTMIVMDNINLIESHDPTGVRFSAAQLFADMSPRGDSIGVVRLISSPTQSPNVLNLTPIKGAADRATIKSKLTLAAFGGAVDPGPNAYFITPLSVAEQALLNAHDSNKKVIVLVTDTAALSADTDNNCTAPANHLWFCTVGRLESEGISVVLLGFTPPGQNQGELQPTRQYIEAHGGTVLSVDDGAGITSVAQQYATLMSLTHRNIYEATLDGATKSVNIAEQDQLTSLKFIALGQSAGLSQVQNQSGGGNIAGQSSNDGTLYHSQGVNYWIQTVSNGSLTGIWQLAANGPPPAQLLLLGTSAARLQLLNPAPVDPNSDASVRLIPSLASVVLRARVTGGDGNPIGGAALVANPLSNHEFFSANTLPTQSLRDSSVTDPSVILGTVTGSSPTLQIGLGDLSSALSGNIYLVKQYQLLVDSQLSHNLTLNIPTSQFIQAGTGVPLNVTTDTSAFSLALYNRDPLTQIWTQVGNTASNNAAISALFTPTHGCKANYAILALAELSGTTTHGPYDYVITSQQPYIANLSQQVAGMATMSSQRTLMPWPLSSQTNWNVTFDSTTCTAQTMQLGAKLQADHFVAPIQVINGGGPFTIVENRTTAHSLSLNIGSCPMSSLLGDQTDTLLLSGQQALPQGVDFVQKGDWAVTVICPSFATFGKTHLLAAGLILFVLSVIVARLLQLPLLPLLPKTHLEGEIEVMPLLMVLIGEDVLDVQTYTPIVVRIPKTQISAIWFLTRQQQGAGTSYTFTKNESPLALLKFQAKHDETGYKVMWASTRYAVSADLPIRQATNEPVSQDMTSCDGEAVVIDKDILWPHLNVIE